jgi:hypothetical protein
MRSSVSMQLIPWLDQDSATMSECGCYRYALTRGWGPEPKATWIMLNPSTADGMDDDPTIRRCKAFTRSWGCGALTVVNLYAWRATNPAQLHHSARDVIGPENNRMIQAVVNTAASHGWPVIAAWGAHATTGRAREVVQIAERAGVRLQCLGTTKSGHPRHPLYVPGATTLRPYHLPKDKP